MKIPEERGEEQALRLYILHHAPSLYLNSVLDTLNTDEMYSTSYYTAEQDRNKQAKNRFRLLYLFGVRPRLYFQWFI